MQSLRDCYAVWLEYTDINIERKGLKDSDDDFYLFHHINDVPFNEKGELLETEEKIRLKKLFWKNYYKFYIGKL